MLSQIWRKQWKMELEGWIADRLKALGKAQDPLIEFAPSMRTTLLESS